MMDLMFQIGLSNVCVASLIALIAFILGARTNRPQLTHVLWMLVLIKLVTPPIFYVPVQLPGMQGVKGNVTSQRLESKYLETDLAAGPLSGTTTDLVHASTSSWFLDVWVKSRPWLCSVWIIGTFSIVSWSLFRVCQFHYMLRFSLVPTSPTVEIVARRIARDLGIRRLPAISITTARLSPLVWWVGGVVHVVLPQSMIEQLTPGQWKWVLAHELAHVRRRDYLVRWLEWFAGALFWWNPLVWWAQRNLRAAEEICCDEWVLSRFESGAHEYAESILAVIESLVCPVIRPPAMASEINSGGFLERRIEMILNRSEKSGAGSLQVCVCICAIMFVPLGLVQAQDFDAVQRRLMKSVKQNELTLVQAAKMMEALQATSHNRDVNKNENIWVGKLEGGHEARIRIVEGDMKQRVAVAGIVKEQAHEKLPQTTKRLIRVEKQDRPSATTDQVSDRHPEWPAIKKRIEGAVNSGQMTREQADKAYAEIKQKLKGDKKPTVSDRRPLTSDERRRAELQAAEKNLAEMVKAGKLTKEQAKERMLEHKRHLMAETEKAKASDRVNKQEGRDVPNMENARKRIENAVQSGTMTREQAKKTYAELELRMKHSKQAESDKRKDRVNEDDRKSILHNAELEMMEQVRAGKMTEQQRKERMTALRDRLDAAQVKNSDADRAKVKNDRIRAELETRKKRIENAVETGKMSREEANKYYESVKQRWEKEGEVMQGEKKNRD